MEQARQRTRWYSADLVSSTAGTVLYRSVYRRCRTVPYTTVVLLLAVASPAQAPHIGHVERPPAPQDSALSAPHPNNGGPGDSTTRFLTLPLSRTNILALSVLLLFSILGCVFLWKLVTRKKCNCKLCNQQYLIQEAIGSGGYGTVFTVKRTEDGKVLVLKKIRVDDITDANFAQAEARELRMLKHPRIVGYSDDFIHVEFMSGMQGQLELEPLFFLVIVMEYCPEGDLSHRIADAYERDVNSSEDEVDEDELSPLPDGPEHKEVVLPESLVLKWMSEMADAMAYVHNANIIHRDIKSPNFFLVNDRVLLGDFGLCRRAVTQTITVGGTDVYMAPEMVMGQRYGKEADMWAVGCVLFELCSGKFMWEIPGILGAQASASPEATQKLLNVVPPGYSKELIKIISSLLSTNPAERPTAEDLLEIPIVKAAYEEDREAWIAEGGVPAPLRRSSSSPKRLINSPARTRAAGASGLARRTGSTQDSSPLNLLDTK